MKNKKKAIIIVTITVIAIGVVIGIVLSFDKVKSLFSSAAGTQKPQNVRVTNVTAGSATIVWQTASPVSAQIEYGTTPGSFLLRATETNPKTNHNLTLSPLLPETIYYFRIRIGEEVYDENGAPYSFTTKSAQRQASPAANQTPQRPTAAPATATPSPATTAPEGPTVVTPTPTSATTPTPTTNAEGTTYTLSDFIEYFGTDEAEFDINNDGVVNSQDWSLYQKENR